VSLDRADVIIDVIWPSLGPHVIPTRAFSHRFSPNTVYATSGRFLYVQSWSLTESRAMDQHLLTMFREGELADPRTREGVLWQIRVVWLCFAISIALYVWIGETTTGPTWLMFHNAGITFVVLAVLSVLSFSWFRRKRYSSALRFIQQQPENILAVRDWRDSWIVLLCIAESETLFGFAFRIGSKTLKQSLPLYVVGALMTLSLWPRRIWSSTRNAT
jgi:hypothetical protein